ncbi:unnamed protein product [Brachionus calyciflorus]|uniref:OTU domain-containing protein n=1 Tax=Brachionus calyciflorus TaxID=104777 RepID=A0A814A5L3_9BILA|nr:unnamed protein product [Brachionus calyciflorus]
MSKNRHDSSSFSNDIGHTEKVFVSNRKNGLKPKREEKNGFLIGRKFNETISVSNQNHGEEDQLINFSDQSIKNENCSYSDDKSYCSENENESDTYSEKSGFNQFGNSDLDQASINSIVEKDQVLPSVQFEYDSDYSISRRCPTAKILDGEVKKNYEFKSEITELNEKVKCLIDQKIQLQVEVEALKYEKNKLLENINILNQRIIEINRKREEKIRDEQNDLDEIMSFMSISNFSDSKQNINRNISSLNKKKLDNFESTKINHFDYLISNEKLPDFLLESNNQELKKTGKKCPTPGCNSEGNLNPNRTRHYDVKFCPLAKSSIKMVNNEENMQKIILSKEEEIAKIKKDLTKYINQSHKLKEENIRLQNEKIFSKSEDNMLNKEISKLKTSENELRKKVHYLQDRINYINMEHLKDLEFKNEEIKGLKIIIESKNELIKSFKKDSFETKEYHFSEKSERPIKTETKNFGNPRRNFATSSDLMETKEEAPINLPNGLQRCPYCGKIFKNALIHISHMHRCKNFLKIPYDDWKNNFENLVSGVQSRKRFKSMAAEHISQKLNENGVICDLRMVNNWFRKNQSQKKRAPFWTGTLKCVINKCNNKFYGIINEEPVAESEVFLELFFDNQCKHIYKKTVRCSGSQRKLESLKVLASGITNVLADNLEHQSICLESDKKCKKCPPVSQSILTQIKYEAKHEFRLSVDFFYDALASKYIFDNLNDCDGEVTGFIQELNLNPFGFLLFSEYQYKMWKKIRNLNPVVHFDATGGIIKDIKGQKKPFLYSMVVHDFESKSIIPIIEFLTTNHTTANISKFLFSIKYILESLGPDKNCLAKIIVTDFSWPLIKSILDVFNKMSVIEYLVWSFDFINSLYNETNDANELECVIYLCSTHFLKNIIKQVNKTKTIEKAKKALIFSFTLLQNSTTLQQIEDYLINIFTMFNSRYLDDITLFSIGIIKDEILFRRLEKTNIISPLSENKNSNEIKTVIDKRNIKLMETEETLVRSSPFSQHFEDFFKKTESKLELARSSNRNDLEQVENEYFSPELFKIIKNQLHLISLWSGLVISPVQDKNKKIFQNPKTRLTNNPVENWFMNLKKFIILNEKKYVSVYTSLLYKSIKKKYFLGFFDQNDYERKKNLKAKSLSSKNEIWKRRLESKRREKSYYYKGIKNFGINEFDFHEEINVNVMNDFTRAFSPTKSKEINILTSESMIDQIFRIYDLVSFEVNFKKIERIFMVFKDSLTNLVEFLKEKKPIYFRNSDFVNDSSFKKLLNAHNLNECLAVETKGDGNCFYYSISYLIMNNPIFYKLVKIGSLFTILEYREFFEEIIRKKAYNEDFITIFMSLVGKNEWANELVILGTSILLEKAIICFCLNETSNKPYTNMFNLDFKDENYLYIGFKTNHFVPLIGSFQNFMGIKTNNVANLYFEFDNEFNLFKKMKSLRK